MAARARDPWSLYPDGGAPLIYGFYYPQPYLGQICARSIAVVDNDLSELSHSIVQTLDASGAVEVAVRAETLAEARAAMDRGEAFAVVGIPPRTQRDVLRGDTARLPVYADATYLFIFRTMSAGISLAINTLSSELAARGARTDGSLAKAALAATSSADILLQPIFNPVGGYASYVVPAAFVLILQQTLLIGSAMLTAAALAQAAGGAFASVLGRGVAPTPSMRRAHHFLVLPPGFSVLGDPLQFFAGVVFMRPAWARRWAYGSPGSPDAHRPRHEPRSFPGRFWPREAIQKPIVPPFHIPTGFHIDGIVRIDQLGAVRGRQRLAGSLGPGHHLFRARGDVRVCRGAEAPAWLAADPQGSSRSA